MNCKPDEYVFLTRTACPVTTQLCIEGCMGFGCLRVIRARQESLQTAAIVKSLLDEAFEILRPNSPEDCPEEPWMRVELGKKFFKVLGKEHVPVSLSDERILEIARATFENIQDLPDDEVNGDTWDLLFARAVLAGSVGPRA